MTDQIPSGVTYVSSTRSQGSYSSSTGVWDVGSLDEGASATLNITVTVDNGTGGDTITNTASVTGADQPDSDDTNNSYSEDITPVNNPPTAPVVDINAENPDTNDDLIIEIVIPSTDDDGDDITIDEGDTISLEARVSPVPAEKRRSAAQRDREIVITFTDTGPGVPEDDLERIFEPFFRGTSSRRESGTGLGLSTVRSILMAHGWSIAAAPGPGGRGLSFTIRLTAAPERSQL